MRGAAADAAANEATKRLPERQRTNRIFGCGINDVRERLLGLGWQQADAEDAAQTIALRLWKRILRGTIGLDELVDQGERPTRLWWQAATEYHHQARRNANTDDRATGKWRQNTNE